MRIESEDRIAELEAAKDNAYAERNKVVAALAKMAMYLGWPVVVDKTAIEGWEPEWHNCLYIESPQGQLSWHFHDSEMYLLSNLPHTDRDRAFSRGWDGHTTEEKYQRLENLNV